MSLRRLPFFCAFAAAVALVAVAVAPGDDKKADKPAHSYTMLKVKLASVGLWNRAT